MPKRSKAARLIQQLQDWSDEELGDLAEMIQGLLESRREEAEEERPRRLVRTAHHWASTGDEGILS
ncbi:hypothetical protein [Myxacorys almedinensis]|uniref:hypothetical protein n=1 Tax=Myxacorys almedinensis TaxID=2651157 RepID=UPI00192EB9E6|nr:hypothetical protein [Myxacorys almedinensis]